MSETLRQRIANEEEQVFVGRHGRAAIDAIQRVRDLHKPRLVRGATAFGNYEYLGCSECIEETPDRIDRAFPISFATYPCATILALGGEQNERGTDLRPEHCCCAARD